MYIALEGVKGSGKSTILKQITDYLLICGQEPVLVEPTRCTKRNMLEFLAEKIPALRKLDFFSERLYALRSNSAGSLVRSGGNLFLGDRSIVTSYVTRWRKWRTPTACISRVDKLEPVIPAPDHLILLDVSLRTAVQRTTERTGRMYGKQDETPRRLAEAIAAYREVRTAPIERLKHTNWHLVDANCPVEQVYRQAVEIINTILLKG